MPARNTLSTHGLSLPDAFTYGQLFAFSGIAGENFHKQDWCGMLTGKPGEIRFSGSRTSPCRMLLRFTESTPEYDVVLSDLIAAKNGAILVTFADALTLVGRSDMPPAIRLETGEYVSGNQTIFDGKYAFSLAVKQTDVGFAFALCRRSDAETAETDAQTALTLDADALSQQILDWYRACPPCPEAGYEKLWYKCLSVNRVNVYSPQDGFSHYFTTPDRLPHRDMWLWDSCFHAMAMAHYAPELAKDAVLAVLECQRADGFIPHTMRSRDEISDITQPPVLCMAIWNLFEATGDLDLLRQTAETLRRYLEWDLQNRRSPNGLMTWRTEYARVHCRCDESGMDNSPRFDTTEQLEAVDFSVFMANELQCMRRIYTAIGEHASAPRMDEMYRETAERINARLWDRQARCYYDRTWGGMFRRILTPASFLPLFAGLCDPPQAHYLVSHLTSVLEYPFPIPSAIDENGGPCTRDMWRGGVWLNYNYFVYIGLQRYGFGRQASILRQKTLEGVRKQFRDTGNVFEFYDPLGGNPLRLDRKGPQPDVLDALAHMHSITDYNWSACFTSLLLRN